MVLWRNLQIAGKSNLVIPFQRIWPLLQTRAERNWLSACVWISKSATGGGCGPDGGQTGSVIRLLISALLEEEWQRHLQAINPCIIFSELRKHQSLPPAADEFPPCPNRTVLTCPLITPGCWGLRMPFGSPPGFSVPSLTNQPRLGQINGTAGSWVFNWAFLMGGG